MLIDGYMMDNESPFMCSTEHKKGCAFTILTRFFFLYKTFHVGVSESKFPDFILKDPDHYTTLLYLMGTLHATNYILSFLGLIFAMINVQAVFSQLGSLRKKMGLKKFAEDPQREVFQFEVCSAIIASFSFLKSLISFLVFNGLNYVISPVYLWLFVSGMTHKTANQLCCYLSPFNIHQFGYSMTHESQDAWTMPIIESVFLLLDSVILGGTLFLIFTITTDKPISISWLDLRKGNFIRVFFIAFSRFLYLWLAYQVPRTDYDGEEQKLSYTMPLLSFTSSLIYMMDSLITAFIVFDRYWDKLKMETSIEQKETNQKFKSWENLQIAYDEWLENTLRFSEVQNALKESVPLSADILKEEASRAIDDIKVPVAEKLGSKIKEIVDGNLKMLRSKLTIKWKVYPLFYFVFLLINVIAFGILAGVNSKLETLRPYEEIENFTTYVYIICICSFVVSLRNLLLEVSQSSVIILTFIELQKTENENPMIKKEGVSGLNGTAY